MPCGKECLASLLGLLQSLAYLLSICSFCKHLGHTTAKYGVFFTWPKLLKAFSSYALLCVTV